MASVLQVILKQNEFKCWFVHRVIGLISIRLPLKIHNYFVNVKYYYKICEKVLSHLWPPEWGGAQLLLS